MISPTNSFTEHSLDIKTKEKPSTPSSNKESNEGEYKESDEEELKQSKEQAKEKKSFEKYIEKLSKLIKDFRN